MKYQRMIAFARTLPAIRARVAKDLTRRGLPQEKVLAAIVRLLETTLVRVGNDEYARQNGSIGLTTMRNRHVDVGGVTMHFEFRGKSGVEHEIDLHDPQLARIVKQCQELPGQRLFRYRDHEGGLHDVTSSDVNEYLRAVSDEDFTAKDFRTWAATAMAAIALAQCDPCPRTARRHNVNQVIAKIAQRLGNTKAVCRKSYIHPGVIEAYLDEALPPLAEAKSMGVGKHANKGLCSEETAVLQVLELLSLQSGKTGGQKPAHRQRKSARPR